MKMRLSGSGCDRSSTWSMLVLGSACLLLALSLFLVGCGGGSSDAGTTDTTIAGQAAATTDQAASMGGAQLGDAAGAIWAEAMQKLTTILSGKPEAAAVKAQATPRT